MLFKNIINIEEITDENQKELIKEIHHFFVKYNPFMSGSYYHNRGYFYSEKGHFAPEFDMDKRDGRKEWIASSLVLDEVFKFWDTLSVDTKSSIFLNKENEIISALSGNKINIEKQSPYVPFSLFSRKVFANVNSMLKCVISNLSQYRYDISRENFLTLEKSNNENLKGCKDLFVKILRNFDSSVIAGCILSDDEIHAMNLFYDAIRDMHEEERTVLGEVKDNLSKTIYENKEVFINSGQWFNWSIPNSFDMYLEYLMENDNVEWSDTYKRMKNKSTGYGSGAGYYGRSLLLLAKKDKDSFLYLFPKGVKAKKDKAPRRKLQYEAFISIGELNKKRVRRMRSDASEDVSLHCVKSLFKYKSLYSEKDFNEYITQFSDTNYQVVINYLENNLNAQQLLGLVGNPLANKNYIFKRINAMREDT